MANTKFSFDYGSISEWFAPIGDDERIAVINWLEMDERTVAEPLPDDELDI